MERRFRDDATGSFGLQHGHVEHGDVVARIILAALQKDATQREETAHPDIDFLSCGFWINV